MSYIDTSVIVAALDPLDHRQGLALKYLEERKDKKVSELSLVELSSVLAKKENLLLETFEKVGLRRELMIPATILYLMRRFELSYKKADGFIKLPGLGELYLPSSLAINMAHIFKLKTLDLFHLAYVKSLIEQGEDIDELVTIDEDFKREANMVKQKLNVEIKFLTSKEREAE